MLQYLGLSSTLALWRIYLKFLINKGKLQMTIPEQQKIVMKNMLL